MEEPFKILIYAIIALAIFALGYQIYLNLFPPEIFLKELQRGLDIANSNEFLGKYYYIGNIVVPKDTIVVKDFFNTAAMSIALECTSESMCCPRGEICSKGIEWDYDRIHFKKSISSELSVRCIRYNGLPVCRFYFVNLPAQAKINTVKIIEQQENQTAITINVENVGNQKLTFGKLYTKIYKYVDREWVDTEFESEIKEIDYLDPKNKYNFLWDFDFKTIGKYLIEFNFEGNNAGQDTKKIEVDINSEAFYCNIDINIENTQTISIIDSNQFKKLHYCIGCNTAYECLNAWNKSYPNIKYELFTKDAVYCITNSYNGDCDNYVESS
jgi:hypothetical protein